MMNHDDRGRVVLCRGTSDERAVGLRNFLNFVTVKTSGHVFQ